MTLFLRRRIGMLSLIVVMAAASAWTTTTLIAQAPPASHPDTGKGENHPVLQNSMRQIEAIKDRLQRAPKDFGGHKAAAIDALNHALNELEQAVQFDKK